MRPEAKRVVAASAAIKALKVAAAPTMKARRRKAVVRSEARKVAAAPAAMKTLKVAAAPTMKARMRTPAPPRWCRG